MLWRVGAFLCLYLTYHGNIPGGSKRFPPDPPAAVRYGYYALLASHIVLAAAVPFLAIATIGLGLADRRLRSHPAGVVDLSYLALCVHHRCHRLSPAVSDLPADEASAINWGVEGEV